MAGSIRIHRCVPIRTYWAQCPRGCTLVVAGQPADQVIQSSCWHDRQLVLFYAIIPLYSSIPLKHPWTFPGTEIVFGCYLMAWVINPSFHLYMSVCMYVYTYMHTNRQIRILAYIVACIDSFTTLHLSSPGTHKLVPHDKLLNSGLRVSPNPPEESCCDQT